MLLNHIADSSSTHSWSTNRFSVGLTGGIGSGKTTVANMFAERGATIIDTDEIAHQLSAPGGAAIPAISTSFGQDFLTASGAMDRPKMREHVFANPHAKTKLESILHPLIRQETERAALQATGTYVMFVVPLLIESGNWKHRVARILAIDCPEEVQIQRVMQRNGLTAAQVRAIMATQVTRETRLKEADDVITNDKDSAALIPQVDRLHALYCSLAG
jgi:dephospho-CoA kinase